MQEGGSRLNAAIEAFAEAKRRRRSRRWRRIVIGMGAVFALLVGAWVALDVAGRKAVQRERAKLRASGDLLDAADLVPPPVPDEDNAAPIYEEVFSLLIESTTHEEETYLRTLCDGKPWDEEKRRDVAQRVSPRDVARRARRRDDDLSEEIGEEAALKAARRCIEEHAAPLGLIRRAAAKPACRFDLDYSIEIGARGLADHSRNLSRLQVAWRMLLVQARLEHRSGNTAGAYDDIITTIRLERAMHQPALFSHCIKVLVLQEAQTALEEILSVDDDHPDHWRRCLTELEAIDLQPGLEAGFRAELLHGVRAFEIVRHDPRQALGSGGARRRNWLAARLVRPITNFDEARYLRLMGEQVRMTRMEPADVMAAEESWSADAHDPPRWAFFSRTLVGHFTGLPLHAADHRARLAQARAALALKLHRHEHGAYPDTLADLAPDILKASPTDPYTGKPLVYRRTKGGFTVYSVGRNLVDDGGNDAENADIVWKVDSE